MTELIFLQDLVVILAAAIAAVVLLHRLNVPSIAGFIIAGTIVGPYALGFIQDLHQVEMLAELGVVLLLFGIGLELSLDRVRRLWRPMLLGGAVQVGTSIGLVLGLSLLFGKSANQGLLLGFIVAVSSTAIVLRGLSIRGRLETPHGRLVIGILIFQDLCVVPMILLIPLLGNSGPETGMLIPLLTAAAVVIGVVIAARLIVPRFLEWIAGTRRRDLFVLSVFLVCLGTAWAVSSVGVSLALGAFLAGLVVSSSRYRHQAISDMVPLRDVLASVFFVSIGMLLDLGDVLDHLLPILGLFTAIIVGKFVIVFLTATVMRLPLRVCVLTASSLAQVGEFSFVILVAASGTGLLEPAFQGDLTVAIILSMLATPFGLAYGPQLAAGLGKINLLTRLLQVRTTEDMHESKPLKDHVIIAGYGLTGQRLAGSLAKAGVPYMIVDMNTENVREAARRGEPACFGDVTSPEVLDHLGIRKAREIIISINDADATARATKAARIAAPDLHITVRTAYESDVARLKEAGASRVFAAEIAVADVITTYILDDLAEIAKHESAQEQTAAPELI